MEQIDEKGRSEKEFLANYEPKQYEKPSITVDILVFAKEPSKKVLLIKRKNHPYLNCWAIPGGFVNMEEDLYQSAMRELYEETRVKDVSLEQLYTYGDVNRDPRMRVISVAYMAEIQHCVYTHAQDDAKLAVWFNIVENDQEISLFDDEKKHFITYQKSASQLRLRSEEALAFDHIKILQDGLHRLKYPYR
ncbi:MAG: NUDIX hydrolase [Longicatena sp.]